MRGLTDRQRQVLEFIAQSITDTGYPPTIREIGQALEIRSTNGVNDHLRALERKGFIERGNAKSRAIQVTPQGEGELGYQPTAPSGGSFDESLSVPVLGRIAAGTPIEAIEQSDEHVRIDPSLLGRAQGADVFALRVEGESMIGDGILDGDLIFVRRQADARRGEMVAVWVDGSATVKRYYRDGDTIRLEPSNPAMDPIFVHAADARETAVLGKVIGVYREL